MTAIGDPSVKTLLVEEARPYPDVGPTDVLVSVGAAALNPVSESVSLRVCESASQRVSGSAGQRVSNHIRAKPTTRPPRHSPTLRLTINSWRVRSPS